MDGWFADWATLAWPAVWPLVVLLACALFATAGALGSLRRIPPAISWRKGIHAARRWRRPYRLLGIRGRDHPAMRSKQALLRACGLNLDIRAYAFWKRLSVLAAMGSWLAVRWSAEGASAGRGAPVMLQLIPVAVIALLLLDGVILERLKQMRRYRIMQEIDAISRHLLYTGGQPVNLHARLLLCLPFARVLRGEWYRLTADWYQGAEEALRRFHERVGTEEARSFAETLNALRQYEDDRYYGLLRERIADNKMKMELLRESRKEAASYLLLVLAGVPIMYTFRLFIYPWVAEGQKLFQLLE